MKVKDLQKKLAAMDPEVDVVCCTEDASVVPDGNGLRFFDIDSVDDVEAEKCRIGGIPLLKFGRSSASTKHVLLNVIADF